MSLITRIMSTVPGSTAEILGTRYANGESTTTYLVVMSSTGDREISEVATDTGARFYEFDGVRYLDRDMAISDLAHS